MSKKVLPQEIDLESLLKKAIDDSGHSREEELVVHDNILEFMTYYNIKSGTFPVKTKILYKMFKAWSQSQNYGLKYFSLKLTQFFQSEKQCVFINYDAIDLTKKAKEVFFTSDSSKKLTKKYHKQQIDKFLNEVGVEPGEYTIPSAALYYIYEEWALNTRKKVLDIRTFAAFIKFYLPYYKEYADSSYFFYINKHTLKVDGVTLEKAKTWAKTQVKKNKNYKEKSNQEGSSKEIKEEDSSKEKKDKA